MFEDEIEAIQTAVGVAEQARAALYQDNGRPLYADNVMERRTAEIQATFEAAVERAGVAVTASETVAQRTVRRIEARETDLLAALSGDDATRAAGLAAFVKEDAARLPIFELTRRCLAAADEGDRAMAFLMLRYVGERRDRELEAFAPLFEDGEEVRPARPAPAQIVELGRALRQLRPLLADANAADALREARETVLAASRVRQAAEQARARVTGTDAARDQMRRAMAGF